MNRRDYRRAPLPSPSNWPTYPTHNDITATPLRRVELHSALLSLSGNHNTEHLQTLGLGVTTVETWRLLVRSPAISNSPFTLHRSSYDNPDNNLVEERGFCPSYSLRSRRSLLSSTN